MKKAYAYNSRFKNRIIVKLFILKLSLLAVFCFSACSSNSTSSYSKSVETTRYSKRIRRSEIKERIESILAKGEIKIIAQDRQFLGYISNPNDIDSILNKYGNYGSRFSSTCIWNPHSKYGNQSSDFSAFNPSASQPPKIYYRDEFIVYLTVNSSLSPSITPPQLLKLLLPLN